MSRHERSEFKHQQQGVSLRTFSDQTGIREGQLRHYCIKGRILGARKHPLTKKWWIYPPAKLVMSGGEDYKPRKHTAARATAQAVSRAACAQACAVAVAFDVGTRPHGLSAILSPSGQEIPEAAVPPSLASSLLPGELPTLLAEPEDQDELPGLVLPGELPSVFTSLEVLEAMRNLGVEL